MLAPRRVVVLFSLSLAAALSLTAFAAAAQPSSRAALSVNEPAQMRREVVWYGFPEASPRTLHIDSTSTNASTEDEFQISYSAGNFTLVYQPVANGPIASRYSLSVEGLLEWNGTPEDGNPGEGAIVAFTPLGPGAFGRYPIQDFNHTTADGVRVDSFLILSNKGDITLNLTIADGFVALPSGQTLTPMEAKLTLEIDHTMMLSGSRLSLQLGISTNQKITLDNQSWDDLQDFSSDERAVNVTNDAGSPPASAYFAWSNSASVNGQPGVVTASPLARNETAPGTYDLYLTYPRPSAGAPILQIVHDPTMGVVSLAYLSGVPPPALLPFEGDALLYVVSLATIAAVVAGTALLVSRRRRRGL